MIDSTSRPSRARFILLGFLSSLVFVLYLDRVCIGQAATDIQQELSISEKAWGQVLGAFVIAYGLFEVPAGRLGDKYGSRGILTRIVIWWSLFTALTGAVPSSAFDTGLKLPWLNSSGESIPFLVSGFSMLLVIRFLFGAGEAGALPNNARVIAQWFPLAERGRIQGIILTSQQLGGALAPVVAAYLIKLTGWRCTFAIFGSVGVIWAVAFYFWFRDRPADHPQVNEAELALIAAGRETMPETTGHDAIPWKLVMSSANVWLLGTIMTCASFASYMYMNWFPRYLQKGWGVDPIDAGWLSTMVLSGGAIGSMLGGLITGRVESWGADPRRARRLYGFICLSVSGLMLLLIPFCGSPVQASLCAGTACLCSQTQVANWWSVVMAISGRHLGALFGLMNSMGVVGAWSSTAFLGWFADYRKDLGFSGRDQWDPAFWIYALVLVAGACCWLPIDPTRSAVEEESPAAA